MCIQRWAMAFPLSICFAASAAAFDIKPGEWEVEVSVAASGMTAPARKTKVCITPEQARNYGENTVNAPAGCKPAFRKMNGASISFEFVCDQEGAKIAASGTSKMIGENEMLTESMSLIEVKGEKMTQRSTSRMKYVGPTCSKTALSPAREK